MTARWQRVEVKLTVHQALRTERLGQCLWPDEKLGIEEVSRRLLLEHVLLQESERNMVELEKLVIGNTAPSTFQSGNEVATPKAETPTALIQ